jgi:hypothetical protein
MKFVFSIKNKLTPLIGLICFPLACYASDDQLTEILNNAVSYAQSGPARAFCMLAIIGVGYLWLVKGVIPKAWAMGVMGGAGFIFGASYIANVVLGIN